IQWILHNWSDEDCVRILKNCKKAIPEKTGKLIIVDMVIDPAGNSAFDDAGLVVDLLMMVQTSGRERTESEWKKILNEGGFPAYKVIKISSLSSIIEAYPV
ncbi:Xanthohumol 4-O-methyltransferase, partial [Linum perenne]